ESDLCRNAETSLGLVTAFFGGHAADEDHLLSASRAHDTEPVLREDQIRSVRRIDEAGEAVVPVNHQATGRILLRQSRERVFKPGVRTGERIPDDRDFNAVVHKDFDVLERVSAGYDRIDQFAANLFRYVRLEHLFEVRAGTRDKGLRTPIRE